MDKKVCIITGANAGIGYEAAKIFAANDWKVFIACRNEEKGNEAIRTITKEISKADIELIKMDLSNKQSIHDGVKQLKTQTDKLDCLIHNAADFDVSRKKPVMVDNVETIWATNHIGPVLLTNLTISLLEKSLDARILTVSSKGLILFPFLKINFNDPEYKYRNFSVPKAYYQSKLAQTMYTLWLSKKYLNTNIKVNCIRVTNVKIDINRYPNLNFFLKFLYAIKSKFSISPVRMAMCYFNLANEHEYKNISGIHFDENLKKVNFPSFARNEENLEKLMEITNLYLN